MATEVALSALLLNLWTADMPTEKTEKIMAPK
jgi:hypothetical protein